MTQPEAPVWSFSVSPSIVVGYDTTHANIASLPRGAQAAGYTTGSPDIKWTAEDWAAHPGALRIDQDGGSDPAGDYLDVEQGAATNADAAPWYLRALASYKNGSRPGQRWPGFYTSANNVTPLVNALIAGGIHSGPRLIVANWNLNELAATLEVMSASGPYPVVGVQFRDPGPYDIDVYSGTWLRAVSVKPGPPPDEPPGWQDQANTEIAGLQLGLTTLARLVQANTP